MELTQRIVVTGIGVVSSVGNTIAEFWHALCSGISGISLISKFDASAYKTRIAGEIKDFHITDYISAKEAKRLDPFCHYAIAATDQAIKQAKLDVDTINSERAGIIVGTGIGGLETFENQCARLLRNGPSKISPFLIPMMIGDTAAGSLAMLYQFQGLNFSIASACATGTHTIGEAFWALQRGDIDLVISGGTEAPITPMGVAGFAAMGAMSERNDDPQHASRPFDRNRDGFVIAEGAGILIMETLQHAQERSADILAEVIGYGASSDAFHMSAPHPEGTGAQQAINIAIKHAQIKHEEIDYINAHGTSTPLNDKYETKAIKNAFGEHAYNVAISSTKSLTGHALGAAGGIEAIACIKALEEGMIPGTYNYEFEDPDCDLNYVPNQTLKKNITTVLSTNFGFGGHNAALVIKKYEE